MNREDIIRMAREAGFQVYETDVWITDGWWLEELKRFAALVAAHEREACAKAVEDYCGAWDDEGYALASAIRARGDNELRSLDRQPSNEWQGRDHQPRVA